MEPIEEITVDIDEEYSSKVIDSMNRRKGKLIEFFTGMVLMKEIWKAEEMVR